MKGPLHILRRVIQRTAERRRRARFSRSVRHVHGPTALETGKNEVIAIVLVRNGSYYHGCVFRTLPRIGIRHFAFIDNGSTDDTLARYRAQPGRRLINAPCRWRATRT